MQSKDPLGRPFPSAVTGLMSFSTMYAFLAEERGLRRWQEPLLANVARKPRWTRTAVSPFLLYFML